MELWLVQGVSKDSSNGAFVLDYDGLFMDANEAYKEAKKLYHDLLNDYGLSDNGASDEEGNSCSGGCDALTRSGGEAVIYDCIESEWNALTERAVVILKEVPVTTTTKVCAWCNQEIEGRSVRYRNNLYHENCFEDNAYRFLLDSGEAEIVS